MQSLELVLKLAEDNVIAEELNSYVDERGGIWSMIENMEFKSVLAITSIKGSIRANHYHKNDYHLCYLTKGKMNYYERKVGSNDKPKKVEIIANQFFYTSPMVEHCMEFVEDSHFICLSRLSRKQQNYEEDTVRLTNDLSKV